MCVSNDRKSILAFVMSRFLDDSSKIYSNSKKYRPFVAALTALSLTTTVAIEAVAAPREPLAEYSLMDFDDGKLHDAEWSRNSQPQSGTGPFVAPKGDSGADTLRLAVGKGRNGGNALEVIATDKKDGLPGFWVMVGKRNGGSVGGYDGYLLPRGMRANQLEMWVKFPKGFRRTSSAAQPPKYPNHQNAVLGSYQFDPTGAGWNFRLVESSNWHFYHQLFLRHDQAEGGWIRIVMNELSNHQRGVGQTPPPNNPTLPAGNYYELLTRFYFDPVPYFADPEIKYPVRLLVDDIKFTYVPNPQDVSVDMMNFVPGHMVTAAPSLIRHFPVTVRNNRKSTVRGTISVAAPSALVGKIVDPSTGLIVSGEITLKPLERKNLVLRIQPKSTISEGGSRLLGLHFLLSDEFVSDRESVNMSHSDHRVERRWQPENGPFDGLVYSDFVRIRIGSPSGNTPPDSVGGLTCYARAGSKLGGQLKVEDPDRDAVTFTVERDPTQGKLVLNGRTGVFSYRPNGTIKGSDFFWYRVSDAKGTSAPRVVWIVDGASSGCNLIPSLKEKKLVPLRGR